MTQPVEAVPSGWLRGTSEMAALVRRHDWGSTVLGRIDAWPDELRSAALLVLDHALPAALVWADGLVTIYNDGYRALLARRHPEALGRSFAWIWTHAWDEIGPLAAGALAGRSALVENLRLPVQRSGGLDEGSFTFCCSPVRAADGSLRGTIHTAIETTADVRPSEAPRWSEGRQAFLMTLGDRLRRLGDPLAIEEEACRSLGEHLDVDRSGYVEIDEAAGLATVAHDFVRGNGPSLAGTHRIADAAWLIEPLRRGACHVISDTQDSPVVPAADRAASAALGIIGCMGVPLVKRGRLVGALCVAAAARRDWTGDEVRLLREVGERIWAAIERSRTEAALREQDALFRSFAENSTDVQWIVNARTLQLEYLGPAFERVFGESRERTMQNLARWSEIIHADDRESALAAMPRSLAGERQQVTYRVVRPSDGAVRWIQDTGFPIRDAGGRVRSVGGISQDITTASELQERQGVLFAELQHRTRNLIGVVRAMADRTAERASGLDGFLPQFRARLGALGRINSLLSKLEGGERVTFDGLIRTELDARGLLGEADGGRIELDGPAGVRLRSGMVQTFALAVHELTANAVAHGALAAPDGRLSLRWRRVQRATGEPHLRIEWIETGVPGLPAQADPPRGGYGRMLIERALPYQLHATVRYEMAAGGLRCTIDLPLR